MNIKVKGIIRYPHLITPSAAKGSDSLNYSVQLLIHKSDLQCPIITKAMNEVTANAYPNGIPKNFNNCWKDLAIEDPNNEALKDYMSLKASTKVGQILPSIVDEKMQPLLDPSVDSTAAGFIGYVVGSIATYNKGSVGVKMYLNLTLVTSTFGEIPLENISSKPSIEEMLTNAVDMTVNNQTSPMSTQAPMPPMPAAAPPMPTPAMPPTAPPIPTPAMPPAAAPIPPLPPIQYQMTEKANGASRDVFISNGWTDEMLIAQGYMQPPNGVTPSFAIPS